MTKRQTLNIQCCDCGKAVESFVIPDKVWDGLGFPLEAHACLACVAKRLNPTSPPDADHLEGEIYRQRRRFKLKRVNKALGEKNLLPEDRLLVTFNLADGLYDGWSTEAIKAVNASRRVRIKGLEMTDETKAELEKHLAVASNAPHTLQ
jgi:hypothetical protein